MTTPKRRTSDLALNNSGPSGSFLQQLLIEIKGRATTPVQTIPPRKTAIRSALRSRQGPHVSSWRRPSVWVGGTSVAQDARDRLRAADEIRFCKTPIQSIDGTPNSHEPLPRLSTFVDVLSPPIGLGTKRQSESDIVDLGREKTRNNAARGTASSNAALPHRRSMFVGMLSPPETDTSCLWADNDDFRAESPLILIESDSDSSPTTSPIEAPSSAVSGTTEASAVSDRQAFLYPGSSDTSPGKRARNVDDYLEKFSKKMRTSTFPNTQNDYLVGTANVSTNLHIFGDDNRRLIRNSEFIERAPALPESISWNTQRTLPELSSFRPDASHPRRSIPATPTRTSMRRASVPYKSPSPVLADTPPFERPLHLVDTELSVYKYPHGERWRENALCLYCFRRYGSFNRVLMHGYEVCGREEMLDSHYWENSLDPCM